MKKIILLLINILLFCNISNSQSGWFLQQSGTTNNFFDTYFVSPSTGWMVGSSSIIYKTTNGGTTWTSQSLGIAQYTIHGIYFLGDMTGWISGGDPYPYNIILKTTNGGTNWVYQTPSINYMLWDVYFINYQTGWVCGWNGTIMKTTNGGINWYTLTSGTTNELYKIYFTDANTGFSVGTYGTILKTTNGGTNWSFYSWSNTTWLRWMHFVNSTTGWISGNSGLILKTTNAGTNWFYQVSGITDDLEGIFFNNSSTGWIVSKTGGILKTSDSGTNWYSYTSLSSNQHSTVFFVDELTGWICGYNDLIMKTTDGGRWLPTAPVLVSPTTYSTGISLTPTFVWNTVQDASTYNIEVSTVSNFATIKDSAVVSGTQYTMPTGKLNYATTYFWRVNASNSAGTGLWSDIWLFSTQISNGITTYESTIPDKYNLYNNYPNPFNPSTKIRFDIPKTSEVTLKIYDALGAERFNIVNKVLNVGKYEYTFDAGKLTSGVYFYKLTTKDYSETKRMILLK
jgi:photosystem II stability/assembly factor-like uncharacterized protein